MKFCLDCKNLDYQAWSARPKTVDSETVLQAIKVNLASSAQAQYLTAQCGLSPS